MENGSMLLGMPLLIAWIYHLIATLRNIYPLFKLLVSLGIFLSIHFTVTGLFPIIMLVFDFLETCIGNIIGNLLLIGRIFSWFLARWASVVNNGVLLLLRQLLLFLIGIIIYYWFVGLKLFPNPRSNCVLSLHIRVGSCFDFYQTPNFIFECQVFGHFWAATLKGCSDLIHALLGLAAPNLISDFAVWYAFISVVHLTHLSTCSCDRRLNNGCHWCLTTSDNAHSVVFQILLRYSIIALEFDILRRVCFLTV